MIWQKIADILKGCSRIIVLQRRDVECGAKYLFIGYLQRMPELKLIQNLMLINACLLYDVYGQLNVISFLLFEVIIIRLAHYLKKKEKAIRNPKKQKSLIWLCRIQGRF